MQSSPVVMGNRSQWLSAERAAAIHWELVKMSVNMLLFDQAH